MELSEDDYKIMCSQQYSIPPPMHLVRTCWPVMSFRQKVMFLGQVTTWIIGLLLLVFGGPLASIMGLA